MTALLKRFIPSLDWLPNYQRQDLKGDMTAGLTTAVMLIPQGMAYAMLAGLPPIIGLYASTLPLVLYALLGTSRQLAVGPVAMVSLLVASGIAPLAQGNSANYLAYAVLLSLMVGAMQLFMGVARLGFLVNFLSHPVISGFTAAAALIIGFSQLSHLLGVNIPRSHHVHTIVIEAVQRAGEIQPYTFALGAVSIVALILMKRFKPTFPRALAVVVFGTLSVALMGLDAKGVKIVGEVPAGLPPFSLPSFDLTAFEGLLPTALTIALVGFMESISVAKSFAAREKYEVEPNQELIALGVANLAGSVVSAYPVTGGFSRTAVNAQAGARTPLASLVTAAIIALTLVLLTPLFHDLPKAVLAAIIMTAVFGLIDLGEVKHLYHVKKGDLALWVLTFFATLSVGIELGILTGVAASLLGFVVRTTRPHTAVLGRMPGTEAFRNVANHPEAEQTPGVLAIRVDAQLYFGNVTFLKETVARLTRDKKALRAVVIDASSVNQLDSSADAALHAIHQDLTTRGIRLLFANVKGPVKEVMDLSGLSERLGPEGFYLQVSDAMRVAEGLTQTLPHAPRNGKARAS